MYIGTWYYWTDITSVSIYIYVYIYIYYSVSVCIDNRVHKTISVERSRSFGGRGMFSMDPTTGGSKGVIPEVFFYSQNLYISCISTSI